MAFENLTSKLTQVFKKLRGKGKLSPKDIDEALREVRLSLLEADVNFKVAREFVNNVKERSLQSEVMESLTPGQQVIKVVNEELIKLLGTSSKPLRLSGEPPVVLALFGLQGSGKTTAAGKIAVQLKKNGKRVLLVSCDTHRPAAKRQLEILAEKAGVGFFTLESAAPEIIAARSLGKAKSGAYNVVIIDTAGRMQVDEEMMEEARKIKLASSPVESLLVADAMTGQEACEVAKSFDEVVGLTGVILTKLDSDTRGGAALSIAKVAGKPIKYVSTGEKLEDIQVFHPDRMASRILGMGDILTLIEKAEESFDLKKPKKLKRNLGAKSLPWKIF